MFKFFKKEQRTFEWVNMKYYRRRIAKSCLYFSFFAFVFGFTAAKSGLKFSVSFNAHSPHQERPLLSSAETSASDTSEAVAKLSVLSMPKKAEKKKQVPPKPQIRECAEPMSEKKKAGISYIKRFHKTAKSEEAKYGIPYAIKMAQGILESGGGQSGLARRNNNHFGMKCFSKKCGKGHCSNFTDDSHKDFFLNFKSGWASYRAHSKLLHGKKRYKPLFEIPADDLQGWATGLKKSGYATDPKYAPKLLDLICQYRLDELQSGANLDYILTELKNEKTK